jgi:hypothetical protein
VKLKFQRNSTQKPPFFYLKKIHQCFVFQTLRNRQREIPRILSSNFPQSFPRIPFNFRRMDLKINIALLLNFQSEFLLMFRTKFLETSPRIFQKSIRNVPQDQHLNLLMFLNSNTSFKATNDLNSKSPSQFLRKTFRQGCFLIFIILATVSNEFQLFVSQRGSFC